MKCSKARKWISQYLEDELAPGEKQAFALHVRACTACREELEELRTVQRMFSAAERFSAPYRFTARVMANLEEKESTWLQRLMGRRPFFLRTAEVAFALAVMTLGLISGNLLLEDKTPDHRHAAVRQSFSLDVFQAAPPDSIGGIYLAYVGGSQ